MTDRQFLASEAWSTSGDLLQNLDTSKVASGVLGVAIRSSPIPGFENYLRSLHPIHRPDDEFLQEFWEKEFGCNPGATRLSSYPSSPPACANSLLQTVSLPPCTGAEFYCVVKKQQSFFSDVPRM